MAVNKKSVSSADHRDAAFSKKQILSFHQFKNRVDLLGALLDDNTKYSLKEVDTILNNFMKGKVKQ